MKIVVYDNSGHPFQVQLSRYLAKLGHYVVHIYSKSFSTPKGNLVLQKNDPKSFNILGLELDEKIQKYNFIKRKFQEKKFGKLVTNELEKINPDVILCSNVPIDTLMVVQKYALRKKIKFISWIQDVYSLAIKNYFTKKNKLLGLIIYKYYYFLERKIFSRSDFCISISHDFRSILNNMKIPDEKITVIENWANLNEIKVLSKENNWSITNNLVSSFNFIYTGTMGLKHNPDLIVALSRHFQGKDVKVIVTSEGLGANYLIEKKKILNLDNLVIMPFQDYNYYSEVLASADVLVAILEKEAGILSVPSKILSYHCAGKPILAAMPLDNLASKILINNKSGLVAETNDINGFLQKAELLYNDERLRQELGQNALKYAKKNFDIDKISKKFLTVINKLTK